MLRLSRRMLFCLAGAAAFSFLGTASPAIAQDAAPIYSDMDRMHPVYAEHGMVASQEALATMPCPA